MESEIALLESAGWVCECQSPLELRHTESGSFATGIAARYVLAGVKSELGSEDDRALESTEEKLFRLFSELKSLQQLASRYVATARKAPAHEDPWRTAYDLVFNDSVSGAVRERVNALNITFEPADFDTSYEEDVTLYVRDLEELITRQARFFPEEP